MRTINRRELVTAARSAVAFSLLPRASPTPQSLPPPTLTLLFQGDSITDAGRNRSAGAPNQADALGLGYPLRIASALLAQHPQRELHCFNRGVSGNTVPDLDQRWQTDALDLKPDILSILIGVNDYWHTLNGSYHGTVSDYETGYAALLERTQAALPAVRLGLLEAVVVG